MRDEEFWAELLAQIEANAVVPVVGAELLTTIVNGREVPFYQRVAERLLEWGGGPGIAAPRRCQELNDAVAAVTKNGTPVQNVYRPVHDIIAAEAANAPPSTFQPLRDLAGIAPFRVFVTTTPDDLLARAIDDVRRDGAHKTDQIVSAPKLASDARRDIPEPLPSGYTAICYLFGKASASPYVFAIHDEDTLEFIHTLQTSAADSMKHMFSLMRSQNLLLIGCHFPDWLTRFFIRSWNVQRLADSYRPKREFLIDRSDESYESLVVFLERFSPNTWWYPIDARDFVKELAQRWSRRSASGAEPRLDPASVPWAVQRPLSERFFISYCHEDYVAASAFRDALNELGADIAWFDKTDLIAGDLFDERILELVRECYRFVPLISASTEARTEGYFRKEWHEASERSKQIQGRAFVVPVVIDADYRGDLRSYRLIPERFRASHVGFAPAGVPDGALRKSLTELIREPRSASAV